jgi:ABC-type transport system involved in multi-copper enzyme maturation permease subunit
MSQPSFPAPGPAGVPTPGQIGGPAQPAPPSGPVPQVLAQLRSELRKTTSTTLWWALLIPAALLSLLVNLATTQGGALAFTSGLGMALALGSFASKFAVVYGVICAATEFRHRTVTTSYLAEPRRVIVVGAKAVVAGGVGALYAVAASAAGLLGVLMGGGMPDAQPDSLFEVCAVATLTFALWAVLGVGVAFLLNNQLAAIVTLLLYLLLVEQILVGVASLFGVGPIEDYLPGGAANTALTDLASAGSLGGLLGGGTLPWWLALLVFAGYALLALVAGAAAAQRRDVT